MKSSMIALSVAAMLAFSTANSATTAAPAAKPTTTAPATAAPAENVIIKSKSNITNNRAAAANPAKPLTPQQQKIGDCAKANKGKKGAEYKAAVSSCLKGGAAAPAAATVPAAPMTQ